MEIRHLSVKNFRGIKTLEWTISNNFNCLIGSGDSCKSTILDAIECLLYDGRSLQFCDADFYNLDTTDPVIIEGVLANLPKDLTTEDKFGLDQKGWKLGAINNSVADDMEAVLVLRLTIGQDLDPKWRIISSRYPDDGREISLWDRQKFASVKVGNYFENQFNWGKGSALYKFSGQSIDALSALLTVSRNARNSVDTSQFSDLAVTSTSVETMAKKFGVTVNNSFSPKIDPRVFVGTTTPIVLCDGDVPVRMSGLGSKRLLMLSMQYQKNNETSVVIADEIEHGLEPHRLRLLVNNLKNGVIIDQEPISIKQQVFITTHSPIVVSELDNGDINVVTRDISTGSLVIKPISSELMGVVEKNSEAVFGRKIIVCEGKTEIGFCRAIDEYWSNQGCLPFGQVGVSFANGNGHELAKITIAFAELGFDTALVKDSDNDTQMIRLDELTAFDICLIDCLAGECLEQAIFKSIPWNGIDTLIKYLEGKDSMKQKLRNQIASELKINPAELAGDVDSWVKKYVGKEDELRNAIGKASHSQNSPWFKSVSGGYKLGRIVCENLTQISTSDLGNKIEKLRKWIYDLPE